MLYITQATSLALSILLFSLSFSCILFCIPESTTVYKESCYFRVRFCKFSLMVQLFLKIFRETTVSENKNVVVPF